MFPGLDSEFEMFLLIKHGNSIGKQIIVFLEKQYSSRLESKFSRPQIGNRYGAWYLKPESWKLSKKSEPLIDPSELQEQEDLEPSEHDKGIVGKEHPRHKKDLIPFRFHPESTQKGESLFNHQRKYFVLQPNYERKIIHIFGNQIQNNNFLTI